MRFALLGVDADTWQLVEHIAHSTDHTLELACVLPDEAQRIQALFPQARIAAEWESLLTTDADGIIVSRNPQQDLRADQLRKLMQGDTPLIVSHPAHESMLICYELDMIRQERSCRVLSYTSARFSPAYQRLKQLAQGGPESPLGELEQVIVERGLTDRDPEQVRAAFARDMDLARPFAGELTRLAALAPSSEPSGYANLGVQLSGPGGALVRWSIAAEPTAGVRLMLVGSRGRATLSLREESSTARVEWTTEFESGADELSTDGAGVALQRFAELVSGADTHPDWVDACRAVELADSIQRSLEKGRTVELHYEDYTEAGTFKGTMTSLGCGLLWASSLVLVLGVVAAGFRLPLADYWPYLLLLVLGGFLLLQLLQFAFPGKQSQ